MIITEQDPVTGAVIAFEAAPAGSPQVGTAVEGAGTVGAPVSAGGVGAVAGRGEVTAMAAGASLAADDVLAALVPAVDAGVPVVESQLKGVVAKVAKWAAEMPAELSAGEEQACAVLMRRFATGDVRHGMPRGEWADGGAVEAGRGDRGLFSRLVSASVVDDAVVVSDAVHVRSLGVPAEDWVRVGTWEELFDVVTGGVELEAGGGVVVPAAVFVRVRQPGTTAHMVGLVPAVGDDGTERVWRFDPDFSAAARQAEIEALKRSGIDTGKVQGLIAAGWAGQWLHETGPDDMKRWSPVTASALFVDESGHVFKPRFDAALESSRPYWALTDPTDPRVAGRIQLPSDKQKVWEGFKKAKGSGISAKDIRLDIFKGARALEDIIKIIGLLAGENPGAIRTFKKPGERTRYWGLRFDPDNPGVNYLPPLDALDIENLDVPPKTVEWLRDALTKAGEAGLPAYEIDVEAFNSDKLIDDLAVLYSGRFRTWIAKVKGSRGGGGAGVLERFYGPVRDANGLPYPKPDGAGEVHELLPSGTSNRRLARLRYNLLIAGREQIAGRKESAGISRRDINDSFSHVTKEVADKLIDELGVRWPGRFRTWEIGGRNVSGYVGPVYRPDGEGEYELPEGARDVVVLGAVPAPGAGVVRAGAAGGGLNADELLRFDVMELGYVVAGVGEGGLRVDEIDRRMPPSVSGVTRHELISRLGDFYPGRFRTWRIGNADYVGPVYRTDGEGEYDLPLGASDVEVLDAFLQADMTALWLFLIEGGEDGRRLINGQFAGFESVSGRTAGELVGRLGDFYPGWFRTWPVHDDADAVHYVYGPAKNPQGELYPAPAGAYEGVFSVLGDSSASGVDGGYGGWAASGAGLQGAQESGYQVPQAWPQGAGPSVSASGSDDRGYGSGVSVPGWGSNVAFSQYWHGGAGSGSEGFEAGHVLGSSGDFNYFKDVVNVAKAALRRPITIEQYLADVGARGVDEPVARAAWKQAVAEAFPGGAVQEPFVGLTNVVVPSFEDVFGAAGGGEKRVAGGVGGGWGAGLGGVPEGVRWVNALRAYSWGLEFVP
ncbi:hypothetical protein NE235_21355, partial [Actinoallomurus spadix]